MLLGLAAFIRTGVSTSFSLETYDNNDWNKVDMDIKYGIEHYAWVTLKPKLSIYSKEML